jgi:hypothetical protein
MQLFENGKLKLLPIKVFPAGKVEEAFRYCNKEKV